VQVSGIYTDEEFTEFDLKYKLDLTMIFSLPYKLFTKIKNSLLQFKCGAV